jgi:hypothetical protein
MQLFGRNQRKALLQIKAHLITENTDGTRAGTVLFACTIVAHMLHQIVVLLHPYPELQLKKTAF